MRIILLFPLDGYPYSAVIVGVRFFAVNAVVPLDGSVSRKLVIGVSGQPFFEYLGVKVLQSVGHGAPKLNFLLDDSGAAGG